MSQISLAAFKQQGLEQGQNNPEQSPVTLPAPSPQSPHSEVRSIQMLMRLSGLSTSVNGGGPGRAEGHCGHPRTRFPKAPARNFLKKLLYLAISRASKG